MKGTGRGTHWRSKRGTDEAPDACRHVKDWAMKRKAMETMLRRDVVGPQFVMPWKIPGARRTGNRAKCLWIHLYQAYTQGLVSLDFADEGSGVLEKTKSFYGIQGVTVLKAEAFNSGPFPMPSCGFEDMVAAGTPFAKATIVRTWHAVGLFEIDETRLGFDAKRMADILSQYNSNKKTSA